MSKEELRRYMRVQARTMRRGSVRLGITHEQWVVLYASAFRATWMRKHA